jgi:hypothetical protein
MFTEADQGRLRSLLVTYFPGRVPNASADAWLAAVSSHSASDVTAAIVSMAETAEFPTLKALRDALDEIVAARAKALEDAATTKLIAAQAGTDLVANRAKLARIAEAVARKASREEIDAIALDGVKR